MLSCEPNNQIQKLRARLAPLNRFKPPVIFYITDRSKVVYLIWFSFVSVSVLFPPSVCLDVILLNLGS